MVAINQPEPELPFDTRGGSEVGPSTALEVRESLGRAGSEDLAKGWCEDTKLSERRLGGKGGTPSSRRRPDIICEGSSPETGIAFSSDSAMARSAVRDILRRCPVREDEWTFLGVCVRV